MRMVAAVCLIASVAACGHDAPGDKAKRLTTQSGKSAAGADTAAEAHPWVPKPILVRPEPPAPITRVAGDSVPSDSVEADSAKAVARKAAVRRKRPYELTPADSARWPVQGPAPLPGALLPEHRIVAYYGNPRSTRMGVLGQLPPSEMLPKLERTATEWARAEPGRKVMPALHLIATVAQGKPGPGGKYRLRHSDQLVEQVLGWAEERGWVVFLDVQIGHSTVRDELPHLVKHKM